jgi:hypothetical protein
VLIFVEKGVIDHSLFFCAPGRAQAVETLTVEVKGDIAKRAEMLEAHLVRSGRNLRGRK